MAKKTQPAYRIDSRAKQGSPIQGTLLATMDVAPPIPPRPPTVEPPTLSTGLLLSAVTPSAYIDVAWDPPFLIQPAGYYVQHSENVGFPEGQTYTHVTGGGGTNARIAPVKVGTTYYIRVAAISGGTVGDYSEAASIVTAQDTSPPGNPSIVSAAFVGTGDLEIQFVPPVSANLRDIEVTIRASAGGTILAQDYTATTLYLWTAQQNLAATSGVGDPSLVVELRSRSWGGYFSPVVSQSVTKARPATPSNVSHNWSGDAGTASADWIISWTAPADAAYTQVSINAVPRPVYGSRYTYSLSQNQADHGGTPDPTLQYSLVAVDGLGQTSQTPASGSAVNAPPAAPSAVTLAAVTELLGITVTFTRPQDYSGLVYRLVQTNPSAADVTWIDTDRVASRRVATAATYQIGVRVLDQFDQTSSEVLSSTVVADLTLSVLRAESIYSDSVNTSPAALKDSLADDDRIANGILYAANAAWRWIRCERPFLDRYRPITLSLYVSNGTTIWYLRTSNDGATWRYFSGPVVGAETLSETVGEIAARSAAISSAALGNAGAQRALLPSSVEARFVELWFQNNGGTTRVDEYYPRRVVQADDGEFETLGALRATLGDVSVGTMAAIDITASTMTSSVVTGGTVRSAASGPRWEGNETRLFGTDGTTTKWEALNATGELTCGAGSVVLNDIGMLVSGSNALRFRKVGQSTPFGTLSFGDKEQSNQFDLTWYASPTRVSRVMMTEVDIILSPNNSGSLTVSDRVYTGNLTVSGSDVRMGPIGNAMSLNVGRTSTYSGGALAGALNLYHDGNDNGTGYLYQRGTGVLNMGMQDAGSLQLVTGNVARLAISPSGLVTIPNGIFAPHWIEVGGAGSGNRNAYIDLTGDATYTDYGLRIIRGANGPNTDSTIENRGTGGLWIGTPDAGFLALYTQGQANPRIVIQSDGTVRPNGGGTQNLGNATHYWADISYKTLTDRGCFGSYDEGVELQDGRVVSDLEALFAIEVDPELKTPAGRPRLKYASLPKDVYRPAPIAEKDRTDLHGNLVCRAGEKQGDDGAEFTAFFSILLGAVKQLTQEVRKLEGELQQIKLSRGKP